LEGRFPTEIFEPSFLAANPPHLGESTTPTTLVPKEVTKVSLSTEEEAAVLARLKALGYIE
jgi:hypothetical protein